MMRRASSLGKPMIRLTSGVACGGFAAQCAASAIPSGPITFAPASTLVAAGQCTGAPLSYVALYNVNDPALSKVFLGDWGSVYCSGLNQNSNYTACTGNGVSAQYGTKFQQARSANGNTLNYRLSADFYGNWFGYWNDSYIMWTVRTNYQGVMSFWNQRLYVDVPQQNVPAGDYRGTYSIPVNVFQGSGCGGAVVTTYTLLLSATIRVGGGCLLGWATSVDLGTISADGNGNIRQNNGFTSIGSACSVNQPYTLSLSSGQNSSGSGAYRWNMRSGRSTIAYGFFTDDGNTSVPVTGIRYAGTGGASSIDFNSVYESHYSFYARIAPSQAISVIEPGVYTDNVIVTMSW